MRVHLVDNSTVCEHDLQTDAVRVHGALLNELDTAGVRCQIASNLAAALRSQIQRHHKPTVFGIFLQSLQYGARFRP